MQKEGYGTSGFLGTSATFSADFNLVAHIARGVALLGGMMLARRKHYRAHMVCQSSVLLLNLPLIALIMFPSFHQQVQPQLPGGLGDSYYAVATVHTVIGGAAQILGLYIILVAGTNLVPRHLRFRRYKLWMRTELALWWVVLLFGIGVYYVWYVSPSNSAAVPAGKHGANRFVITLTNFQFQPKTLTVTAGTTVQWIDAQGVHTVDADHGAFKSSTLTPGHHFAYTFTRPGTYVYHCDFHGGPGGAGMSARIIVTSQGSS